LYAEQFYAIIPTLVSCFLLICYPYILLHFNVLSLVYGYIARTEGIIVTLHT